MPFLAHDGAVMHGNAERLRHLDDPLRIVATAARAQSHACALDVFYSATVLGFF
jgi:hypothetical protein